MKQNFFGAISLNIHKHHNPSHIKIKIPFSTILYIFQDYQEMKIQLSDIPVNPYTTSELVRLCLRKQDVEDDTDNDGEENLEDEVVIIPLYVANPVLTSEFMPGFVNYKKGCTRLAAASDLPVACPWSMVLSGYSGFFHH
jgi:hypothetical protein